MTMAVSRRRKAVLAGASEEGQRFHTPAAGAGHRRHHRIAHRDQSAAAHNLKAEVSSQVVDSDWDAP